MLLIYNQRERKKKGTGKKKMYTEGRDTYVGVGVGELKFLRMTRFYIIEEWFFLY